MRPPDRRLMPRIAFVAFVLVLGATASACGPTVGTTTGAGPAPAVSDPANPGAPGTPSEAASQIPAGREIAEGGGGPVNYTFREEWRRALPAALKWRSGAYLVTAVGGMVNDDGVPSSWRLTFADAPAPDAVLLLDMDPWGKVTGQREVTGSGASGLVGSRTKPVPYAVIDSDAAVAAGKGELADRIGATATKDPALTLNFGPGGGSGPYWVYTVFVRSSAEYVSVRMDALTGKVVPAP